MNLEQLKALPYEDLRTRWDTRQFPFDMAKCGHCISMHHPLFDSGCKVHAHFVQEVGKHSWSDLTLTKPNVLEEMFAMRLFFADLYEVSVPADALPAEKPAAALEESYQLTENLTAINRILI